MIYCLKRDFVTLLSFYITEKKKCMYHCVSTSFYFGRKNYGFDIGFDDVKTN